MAFPLIFDIVVVGDIVRGRDSLGTSIALLLIVVLPLTALIAQFFLFYYLERDGEHLRLVKFYGLGCKEIPVAGINEVRLRKGGLGYRRLEFVSPKDVISIMPNGGRLWPLTRLSRLVGGLQSDGVHVDAEAASYLSLHALSQLEPTLPSPRTLPPYGVMAPLLWAVVFGAGIATAYVLGTFGNFLWAIVTNALLATGVLISLTVTYRINR